MPVLVSHSFRKIRSTMKALSSWHHFPHYKSMGIFGCHGNQSFDPSCRETLRCSSPISIMLHIQFEQDWQTGLRDIQVWMCGRRWRWRQLTDDDRWTTESCYTINSPSVQVSSFGTALANFSKPFWFTEFDFCNVHCVRWWAKANVWVTFDLCYSYMFVFMYSLISRLYVPILSSLTPVISIKLVFKHFSVQRHSGTNFTLP